jgi:hypothetical protein
MDWDVRGVGDEGAVWSEYSARKVKTFFNVGADRGALENSTHLLGDAHEAMGEDGKFDGIDFDFFF